jgi:hypothetical protein
MSDGTGDGDGTDLGFSVSEGDPGGGDEGGGDGAGGGGD